MAAAAAATAMQDKSSPRKDKRQNPQDHQDMMVGFQCVSI